MRRQTIAELNADTLKNYLEKATKDSDERAIRLDNPKANPSELMSKLVGGYFKGGKKPGRKPTVSPDELSRRKDFAKLVNREGGISRATKQLASKAIELELDKPEKPRYTVSSTGLKLKEEFPTNAMGASSSTAGSGPVDTFDPILKLKKKILKRKVPAVKLPKGVE